MCVCFVFYAGDIFCYFMENLNIGTVLCIFFGGFNYCRVFMLFQIYLWMSFSQKDIKFYTSSAIFCLTIPKPVIWLINSAAWWQNSTSHGISRQNRLYTSKENFLFFWLFCFRLFIDGCGSLTIWTCSCVEKTRISLFIYHGSTIKGSGYQKKRRKKASSLEC